MSLKQLEVTEKEHTLFGTNCKRMLKEDSRFALSQ